MQYINDHPSILTSPIYADFANNNENQARLNETSEKIARMRRFEESTNTSLIGNYTLISLLVDTLNYLNEQNAFQPITNFQNIVKQLTQQLINVKQLNENLLLQSNLLQQANYNQAAIANGGVITTEVPQVNSHFVNEVTLSYEAIGIQAILNYYPSLEVLANQCPYQGGKAVLQARHYVSLINDSVEYNDDLNCLMAGIWRASNTSTKKDLKMNISPNPTTGNFKLSFNKPINDECIVTIISNTGQTVWKSNLNIEGAEAALNTGLLVSGIYQIKLIGKNIGLFNERITVIK